MLPLVIDDPSKVSPGVAGFLVVFVLALATWLLIRSMVGHLRKVRYQHEREVERQREQEAVQADRADTAEPPPSRATGPSGGPTVGG